MLSRKHRAIKSDIEQVIRSGKVISADFVYVKVSKTNETKASFAIVVPKKVEKTSVGRHHLKRMISACIEEIFLPHKEFMKTAIFFAKKPEKQSSFTAIKKDMLFLAKELL